MAEVLEARYTTLKEATAAAPPPAPKATAAKKAAAQVEAQPAEESQPSADAPEKLSFQPVPGETWSSDTLTGEESGDAPSRGGESVEDSSGDEPGEPRS